MKIIDHTELRQRSKMYHDDKEDRGIGTGFAEIDAVIESFCYTPPGLEDVPDSRPHPPGPRLATDQSIESAVKGAISEILARSEAPDMVGLV